MVTKHFFSILLGCLTALCITSCLGSDDDANNSSKGLSKAEIAQCYLTVGGNYSGDLLYFSKSDDGLFEEVDTLDGAWYIPTDSTLFITDFPSEVLAENVIYSELKDALAEAPDQIVKCRIRFVETSPVQFLVNPYTLEYMLHYGGGDHKVQVVFYNENIYSFGVLNAESRELMLKIIPAYLYVDGKQTNYLTQSQIIFVSRKQ